MDWRLRTDTPGVRGPARRLKRAHAAHRPLKVYYSAESCSRWFAEWISDAVVSQRQVAISLSSTKESNSWKLILPSLSESTSERKVLVSKGGGCSLP